MSTMSLFQITFYFAAPCWALMIFAPGWSWTRRIIGSPWIVLPPLVIYTVLAAGEFGTLWSVVSSPDLDALKAFLAPILVLTILLSPFGLLAYLLIRSAALRRLHATV